jgi:hypothetical protein
VHVLACLRIHHLGYPGELGTDLPEFRVSRDLAHGVHGKFWSLAALRGAGPVRNTSGRADGLTCRAAVLRRVARGRGADGLDCATRPGSPLCNARFA